VKGAPGLGPEKRGKWKKKALLIGERRRDSALTVSARREGGVRSPRLRPAGWGKKGQNRGRRRRGDGRTQAFFSPPSLSPQERIVSSLEK